MRHARVSGRTSGAHSGDTDSRYSAICRLCDINDFPYIYSHIRTYEYISNSIFCRDWCAIYPSCRRDAPVPRMAENNIHKHANFECRLCCMPMIVATFPTASLSALQARANAPARQHFSEARCMYKRNFIGDDINQEARIPFAPGTASPFPGHCDAGARATKCVLELNIE